MEENNIVLLTDEHGNEVAFEFLDLVEFSKRLFVVLLPVGDEEDEVVILEIKDIEGDEEEEYISVEDESVLMAVFEIFKEKCQDRFDFVD